MYNAEFKNRFEQFGRISYTLVLTCEDGNAPRPQIVLFKEFSRQDLTDSGLMEQEYLNQLAQQDIDAWVAYYNNGGE